MKRASRSKKIISLLLMFVVLLQVILPLLAVKSYAIESDTIVNSLEITDKKDEYYPGESVRMEGEWSIPNDTPNKQYKGGDTFSITIPNGLRPGFGRINLGEMGIGKIVGNQIEFEFTDKIEGLVNRHGGFQLRFEVETPEEKGKIEIDLESRDGNENIVFADTIVVNNPDSETNSDEDFGKGKQFQTFDGLRWYMRINHNGSIKGKKIKLEDRLGPDHILKKGSLVVKEHKAGNVEDDITDRLNIVIDSDKKGFEINGLDIKDEFGGYKYYTIYYDTEYTGDQVGVVVELENMAKIITENNGILYPDHADEDNIVIGELDLNADGWGTGEKWLKFKLKKIDSITGDPLAGAKFKLSHKIDENFKQIIFTTDENGEYNHGEYIQNGLYVLEELEAPEGYKKVKPKDISIIYDEQSGHGDDQVFKIEVENELKPIDISVTKVWKDKNGDVIEPQEDIAISLYANGDMIRQKVLLKDDQKLIFDNLPNRDKNGDIKYTVKEAEIKGYETLIEGNTKLGFTITNTEETPLIPLEPAKRSVNVEKVWKGKVGESVTINLLADGEKIKDITLSEANNWEHTFTDLPTVNEVTDEKPIEYTVEEVETEGYETSIAGNAKLGYTITNTEIKPQIPLEPAKTSVDVEKVWKGKVGESVTINLLADGEKIKSVVLSEANNWKHTFTDLPTVNEITDEKPIEYTVEEVEIEGYETSIAGNAKLGYTITNTEIKPLKPIEPEKPKKSEKKEEIVTIIVPKKPTLPKTGIESNIGIYLIGVFLIILGALLRRNSIIKK